MGRQPVVLWQSAEELDAIQPGNPDGFRGVVPMFHTPDLTMNGIGGVTSISRWFENGGPESWEPANWAASAKIGLAVYPGSYCITQANDPDPFAALGDDPGWSRIYAIVSAAAVSARAAKCAGMSLDLENYDGAKGTFWNAVGDVATARQRMRARAAGLGAIYRTVGPVIVYTSSNAAAPGTYQDKVEINAKNGALYATNLFPDFVAGLRAGGATVVYVDSVFASGVQLPGRTWETGIAESVQLAQSVMPGVLASVMLWPDNDESHGPFAATDMVTAFEAATRLSSGPVVCYEHQFVVDQLTVSVTNRTRAWNGYLAAIRTATTSIVTGAGDPPVPAPVPTPPPPVVTPPAPAPVPPPVAVPPAPVRLLTDAQIVKLTDQAAAQLTVALKELTGPGGS